MSAEYRLHDGRLERRVHGAWTDAADLARLCPHPGGHCWHPTVRRSSGDFPALKIGDHRCHCGQRADEHGPFAAGPAPFVPPMESKAGSGQT